MAELYFTMAAEQGNAGIQSRLGARYADGKGVPQDYTEAAKWYRRAAEDELSVAYVIGPHIIADAKHKLGCFYGSGVPQDYAEAMKWFLQAAELGNCGALYSIADLYEKGRGIPQNYTEAVNWYRKAADLGYRDAQVKLFHMYRKGCDVPEDKMEAMNWYRKADAHTRSTMRNGIEDKAEAMEWLDVT